MTDTENFADMFAQTEGKRAKFPRVGDKVAGHVTSVGKKHAVIDLGGGVDAMVDLVAFEAEDPPVVGDRFNGVVVSIENRTVNVDRRVGRGESGMRVLEQAKQAGVPVEGVVTEVNKGGYVIEASGVRCFCPLAQMALRRIEDPNTMLGQKLEFLVQEVKDREAILSRRAFLEIGAQEQKKKTLAALKVGERITGTVSNVRDFGAFVDLGGVDGLIPVSEMAWGKVRAQEFVTPGQTVEVEIIALEGPEGAPERITLSMRALGEKPVVEAKAAPGTGTIHEVTVDKIESFGLFVSFAGGRGLLPKSELGEHEGDLRKKYPVGTVLKAAIVAVRADGKIRFSKKAAIENAERADADAFLHTQAGSGFGTLADKLKDAMQPKAPKKK